jgi:hypothetical protein
MVASIRVQVRLLERIAGWVIRQEMRTRGFLTASTQTDTLLTTIDPNGKRRRSRTATESEICRRTSARRRRLSSIRRVVSLFMRTRT